MPLRTLFCIVTYRAGSAQRNIFSSIYQMRFILPQVIGFGRIPQRYIYERQVTAFDKFHFDDAVHFGNGCWFVPVAAYLLTLSDRKRRHGNPTTSFPIVFILLLFNEKCRVALEWLVFVCLLGDIWRCTKKLRRLNIFDCCVSHKKGRPHIKGKERQPLSRPVMWNWS